MTVPPAGSLVPANAAVLFVGPMVKVVPNHFHLEVAGEPAEFYMDEAISFRALDNPTFRSALALRPAVEPAVGDEIKWRFTNGEFGGDEWTFVASASDHERPPPPGAAFFNLYDFGPTHHCCNSCKVDEHAEAWLHVDESDPGDGSAVFRVVEIEQDGPLDGRIVDVSPTQGGPSTFELGIHEGAYPDEEVDPEGLCFIVRIIDAAGNEAESHRRMCAPCYFREDEPSDEGLPTPSPREPAWTRADAYPRGDCEGTIVPGERGDESGESGTDGSGTSGGGASDDYGSVPGDEGSEGTNGSGHAEPYRGCACESAAGSECRGTALLMLTLIGLRRRNTMVRRRSTGRALHGLV